MARLAPSPEMTPNPAAAAHHAGRRDVRGGAATAVLALALAITAALFDAEPLWVPAVALGLLAVAMTTWVLAAAHGVAMGRTLSARRVVEDEPLRVVLSLRAGRLPLPTAVLEDPLLSGPTPVPPGRRAARVRVNVRFARRGRRTLAGSRVTIRDPLGLASVTVTATASAPGDDELLVLPRIEPVRASGSGDDSRGARRGRIVVGAEVDVDGVRPLREGTPASRIFWPSLARGAEPMERRLSADGDSRPLVVLDPRAPNSAEDLDAAVRATASLAVHLAGHGGCALLLPGDRRPAAVEPGLAGWDHLHARLALVTESSRPNLVSLSSRRGALIYVSARRQTRPPQVLAHSPSAGRVLVVPGALPERRAAFAVAGCHGYALAGGGRGTAAPGAVAAGAAR